MKPQVWGYVVEIKIIFLKRLLELAEEEQTTVTCEFPIILSAQSPILRYKSYIKLNLSY